MKIKSILAGVLLVSTFIFSAPQSHAYVDSMGRVWPGKKPVAKHKVVKKPVVKVSPKAPVKKK